MKEAMGHIGRYAQNTTMESEKRQEMMGIQTPTDTFREYIRTV